MSKDPRRTARGVAGLWAGLSLGGSLIAAPAKFQAPSLTRTVALDVGRAQFYWLTATEVLLGLALLLALARIAGGRWRWPLVASGLFALQQAVIMPPLDARTLQIIGGAELASSPLHVVYIVAEVLKFGVLAALGTGFLAVSSGD
ncbi:MAG: hypothetical protein AAF690_19560 [Acidobacteriota bacterium]